MEPYVSISEKTFHKIVEIAQSTKTDDEFNNAFVSAVETYGWKWITWFSPIMESARRGQTIPTYEIKTYYRIGEPQIDDCGNFYKPSYNFADQKYEYGISVVTKSWLNSLKSVFWNAELRCKTHGIYSFRGVQIGVGGDDEPVVMPIEWAKKERIHSISGLKKLIG